MCIRDRVKQPCQGDVARFVAELGRKVLVRHDRLAVGGEGLRRAALEPTLALAILADDPAEEPALKRGPRDEAEAVGQHGRDDLELDVARQQVVDGLLADQPGDCLLYTSPSPRDRTRS